MISIQSSKTFKVLENRNFIFSQLETSSNPRDGAQEDFRKKNAQNAESNDFQGSEKTNLWFTVRPLF